MQNSDPRSSLFLSFSSPFLSFAFSPFICTNSDRETPILHEMETRTKSEKIDDFQVFGDWQVRRWLLGRRLLFFIGSYFSLSSTYRPLAVPGPASLRRFERDEIDFQELPNLAMRGAMGGRIRRDHGVCAWNISTIIYIGNE